MSKRPFAAFDIDGTIIRWQLYHAVSDQLAKDGQISADAFERVRQSRMNWKRRTGEDSFLAYEAELIKAVDEALAGMSVTDFNKAVDKVFEEYKDQVYTYTRDLIHELQGKNYLLFAISGSPGPIVTKLARYYGFDDFAATKFQSEEGRFTGSKDLSIGKKPQLLTELIARNKTGLKGSIAVGDSEGDITMLEMVDKPIAFNPSRQLFQHARKAGWPIILERKNVVYELDPEAGRYVLR